MNALFTYMTMAFPCKHSKMLYCFSVNNTPLWCVNIIIVTLTDLWFIVNNKYVKPVEDICLMTCSLHEFHRMSANNFGCHLQWQELCQLAFGTNQFEFVVYCFFSCLRGNFKNLVLWGRRSAYSKQIYSNLLRVAINQSIKVHHTESFISSSLCNNCIAGLLSSF